MQIAKQEICKKKNARLEKKHQDTIDESTFPLYLILWKRDCIARPCLLFDLIFFYANSFTEWKQAVCLSATLAFDFASSSLDEPLSFLKKFKAVSESGRSLSVLLSGVANVSALRRNSINSRNSNRIFEAWNIECSCRPSFFFALQWNRRKFKCIISRGDYKCLRNIPLVSRCTFSLTRSVLFSSLSLSLPLFFSRFRYQIRDNRVARVPQFIFLPQLFFCPFATFIAILIKPVYTRGYIFQADQYCWREKIFTKCSANLKSVYVHLHDISNS